MALSVNGKTYDTMGDACERLVISRSSMLRYFKSGFFTAPSEHKQGRGKIVKIFDEGWYAINEARLEADRRRSATART